MPLVPLAAPMSDVLAEISHKGFGVTGVVDGTGHLAGIITNGDLNRHMDRLSKSLAQDVMTTGAVTITPDALAEKAVGIMNTRKITCLIVVAPENAAVPVGILHLHDCLRVGLG